MDHEGINLDALAKLYSISLDDARKLVDSELAEMRRAADDFLLREPDLRKQFEAQYEQDKKFLEARGRPAPDRATFLRSRALNHQMRERMRANKKKIKASDVAAASGGELPPGWDDLLPPETVEHDTQ